MTPLFGRRVRAVLFDVDGTLYAQPPLRAVMAAEIAACAAFVPRQRARVRAVKVFRELREGLRADYPSDGTLAEQQYAVAAKHLACDVHEVKSAVDEWIHRRPLKWLRYCRRPGLMDLLALIRSRGLLCGVFSDYPAAAKLAALGVRTDFGLILSADDPEISAFKPNPRGFVTAARKWSLAPAEVLYVGDRVDVDAAGAVAAGMPCAVLSRRGRRMPDGVVSVRDFKELYRVLCRAI